MDGSTLSSTFAASGPIDGGFPKSSIATDAQDRIYISCKFVWEYVFFLTSHSVISWNQY